MSGMTLKLVKLTQYQLCERLVAWKRQLVLNIFFLGIAINLLFPVCVDVKLLQVFECLWMTHGT